MYCTSTQLKLLSEQELISYERQGNLKLPRPYRDFMKTYGDGTYSGVICINLPDFHILNNYSQYDFWQYETAPITQEQIEECVVIGNSIDGDYIAIHRTLNGYILLPRHSDMIEFFPYSNKPFLSTICKIGYALYDEALDNYFEPTGAKHLFLKYYQHNLHGLSKRFKAAFQYDYLIENEYICKVFLYRMGDYVRFNYAYSTEVTIFYNEYGFEYYQEIKKYLNENGCK